MPQLIEAETIDAFGVTVGFIHIPGAGFRVATRGGGDEHTRHYAIAKARRLGRELVEADRALKPVADLIDAKCARLEAWLPRWLAMIDDGSALTKAADAAARAL